MPDEQREPTQARVHELKTLPGFIDAIEESGKNFEVRINDRRFLTGDTLRLREFDPDEGYSGREIERVVGYVLEGFPGIESGYCVMALEPASPSEQREGEARGDLAERLEAAAKATVGRHSDLLREAASTLDHQTKALEAADELRSAALDLLDSLGAPHYHDLIGMTYTLRKEQADNLRRALEPASPTPTGARAKTIYPLGDSGLSRSVADIATALESEARRADPRPQGESLRVLAAKLRSLSPTPTEQGEGEAS
jgi:ParB family chromosome partitioning protein